jgi:hypothetical protein
MVLVPPGEAPPPVPPAEGFRIDDVAPAPAGVDADPDPPGAEVVPAPGFEPPP